MIVHNRFYMVRDDNFDESINDHREPSVNTARISEGIEMNIKKPP